MNFLMRPSHTANVDKLPVQGAQHVTQPASTLGVLIAEDTFLNYYMDEVKDEVGDENGSVSGLSSKRDSPVQDKFSDVSDEEGWIVIPYKGLADNWRDASDIGSFRSLDRPFLFSGEQVHILACLSSSMQDTEIITPFKVAAMMNKNGFGQSTKNQSGEIGDASYSNSGEVELNSGVGEYIYQNGENLLKEKLVSSKDISASESLLRLEDHKRQTEIILQKFKSSHFFVQIAESGETLWSKKGDSEKSIPFSGMLTLKSTAIKAREIRNSMIPLSAVVDRGHFNANVSGGVARNIVDCFSLSNGDVVVLLQVNVAVDCLKDQVLEILQFEKFNNRKFSENQDSLVNPNQDPCGELLKWLLPLDNALPPPTRTLSPPLASSTGIGSTSQRSTAASSGSQLFSFGHFRSYSMSSLPQNTNPPPPPVATPSPKPNFELEDWFSPQKFVKSKRSGSEELLSFRGVSLDPERFSVCCGLEGIYITGRRWRRKLEIIQPVEICSFSADCNTDDLLCVQIKNVSPAHTPDIVVYLDAVTVIFEEPSAGGSPRSVPLTCIEAGNGHSLPNLALRPSSAAATAINMNINMDAGNLKMKEERVPQWSHQETRDFIAVRAELERNFALTKRNKTLWEAVTSRMKEMGYHRTPDQCKCKWKNLVNRYKGKETSDPENGRNCPFFEELHAVFTERAKTMQRLLLDSEAGSTQAGKRARRINAGDGDHSLDEFSEDEDDAEGESEAERLPRSSNSRKRKADRERSLKTTAASDTKSVRLPNVANINSTSCIPEMLKEFFQQQQRMEIQWWEAMERRTQERQMFEQEWRQSMENLQREQLMVEQAWREREEQRRAREESRAEKRDVLLTTLLNKLIHDNHL